MENYIIDEAADGDEAVNLAKQKNYDLIITVLPGFGDLDFKDSQVFLLNLLKKSKIL